MIEASSIARALVVLLQDIPELVTAVGGNADNIIAYVDQFGQYAQASKKIRDMQPPQILVVFSGRQLGSSGEIPAWQYRFEVAVKASTQNPDDPSGYTVIDRLLIKGVPASLGVPMEWVQVLPNLLPMTYESLDRQSDEEGIDYFAARITFTEIGDQ